MRYARQTGIISPELLREADCTVIGLGGIGSFATFALAKMGVGKLRLYDADIVELHNTSNQFYPASQLGRAKVEAIGNLVTMTFGCEAEVLGRREKVTADTQLESPVVLSCVDSIESRVSVFQAALNCGAEYLVDIRLGAEDLRFFSVPLPQGQEQYALTLYSDEAALELPCTARAIIYTGLFAGSLMASAVKGYLAGERSAYRELAFNVPLLQVL